jgi:hypothetical protein
MTSDDLPVLSDPYSLEGELQRGRGAGYLHALRVRGPEAKRAVLDCVMRDPRTDSQVERRSAFYSALLIELGANLEPLREHLWLHDVETNGSSRVDLTLETLGELARRGDGMALGWMREHIRTGKAWIRCFSALQPIPFEPWREELLADVMARTPSVMDFQWIFSFKDFNTEPLRTWRATNSNLDLVYEALCDSEASRARVTASIRQRGGDELLQSVDNSSWREVGKVLGARTDVTIDQLVAAARSLEPARAIAGLIALSERGADDRLGPAVEVLEAEGGSIALRAAARRALRKLPPHLVLPTIRRWSQSMSEELRYEALSTASEYATTEDDSWIVEAFRHARAEGHLYGISSAAEALARFSSTLPLEEIEEAFVWTPYSYNRIGLARLLPCQGTSRLSAELLWDCEEGVRVVGCEHAARDAMPEQKTKLASLAADPFEEDEVRVAAVWKGG